MSEVLDWLLVIWTKVWPAEFVVVTETRLGRACTAGMAARAIPMIRDRIMLTLNNTFFRRKGELALN